jgi:predicted TIM-barrel fold metal-dependent hydrolase
MKVIDTHYHLGDCRVFSLNAEEDAILAAMEQNGVDAAVVQPFPGASDPRAVHDRIAALARRQPGRVYGMVSLYPHMPDRDAWNREVERCVRDLGFKAIKLHTIGHALNPLSEDGGMIFEAARRLGIAVMVHTGMGIPLAAPSLVGPRAEQYPDVPIVLAHMGFVIAAGEAVLTAKRYPNLYVETSWSMIGDIQWAIQALGPDRVMFGSDTADNLPVEVAKYRAMGLDDETRAAVLGGTAARVFKLN